MHTLQAILLLSMLESQEPLWGKLPTCICQLHVPANIKQLSEALASDTASAAAASTPGVRCSWLCVRWCMVLLMTVLALLHAALCLLMTVMTVRHHLLMTVLALLHAAQKCHARDVILNVCACVRVCVCE